MSAEQGNAEQGNAEQGNAEQGNAVSAPTGESVDVGGREVPVYTTTEFAEAVAAYEEAQASFVDPDAELAGQLARLSAWQQGIAAPSRPQRSEVLEAIAGVHERTPVEILNAEGVQARAWMILRAEYAEAPSAAVTRALVGFYCAVFDLDVTDVSAQLRAYAYRTGNAS